MLIYVPFASPPPPTEMAVLHTYFPSPMFIHLSHTAHRNSAADATSTQTLLPSILARLDSETQLLILNLTYSLNQKWRRASDNFHLREAALSSIPRGPVCKAELYLYTVSFVLYLFFDVQICHRLSGDLFDVELLYFTATSVLTKEAASHFPFQTFKFHEALALWIRFLNNLFSEFPPELYYCSGTITWLKSMIQSGFSSITNQYNHWLIQSNVFKIKSNSLLRYAFP